MLNWNQLVRCSLLHFLPLEPVFLFLWGNQIWLPAHFHSPLSASRPGYYDCQSFFEHKGAHLKRLNANLISYMKQSWFIFPQLFFLSLQTTSQRTPSPYPPTPLAGITPFNIQSKEWGSALWTVATILQHLTPPTTTPPRYPFSFPSSRYLPTAGAAPGPEIAVILREKYWKLHLYSAHITVIRLFPG